MSTLRDEIYTGWGLEDSDLVIRLLRAGVRNKSARFSAPVFHLWHRENDRSHLAENHQRLQAVLQATHIRAVRGMDQYQAITNPLQQEAGRSFLPTLEED